MIPIGPAGWSYKDWEGIVYPPNPPKGFHGATYLAQFFDTIEGNSSFYRPPTASIARGWVQRISGNPRFKFTAKLWRGFTHERRRIGRNLLDGLVTALGDREHEHGERRYQRAAGKREPIRSFGIETGSQDCVQRVSKHFDTRAEKEQPLGGRFSFPQMLAHEPGDSAHRPTRHA